MKRISEKKNLYPPSQKIPRLWRRGECDGRNAPKPKAKAIGCFGGISPKDSEGSRALPVRLYYKWPTVADRNEAALEAAVASPVQPVQFLKLEIPDAPFRIAFYRCGGGCRHYSCLPLFWKIFIVVLAGFII